MFDGGEKTGAAAILRAIANRLQCRPDHIEIALNKRLKPTGLDPLEPWRLGCDDPEQRLAAIREGVGTPKGVDVLKHLFLLIDAADRHRNDR